MKWFIIFVVAIAAGLFAFTRLVAAPKQLDYINSLWPGDSGVERVGDSIIFSEKTGLKLDVWAKPRADKALKPVIIFYYGGGWANGARDHYSWAGKALSGKDFIAVVPDYRKVPQVRFPAFVEDGAEAIKWVMDNITRYGGDPNRITLAGHSAGAHIAVMLTLDQHYLTDIGVDPKIIRATVGLSGPYDFLPLDSKRSINAMSGWPRLEETQPIHFARADAPPIMVVTSTEDDTVKPRNAILLSEKLHSLGTYVIFKVYGGLNHEQVAMALSKPFRKSAPVLDDMTAFLSERLAQQESKNADTGRRLSDPPNP
jgi:acetyl esterase/lipase